MDNYKNLETQKDSAPPAGFFLFEENYNNKNSNSILGESNYSLFSSFQNDISKNNSNNINQYQINSFAINENKIQKNSNIPTYQYYNMMNLNNFNQGNIISNNINKINSDDLGDKSLMIDIPYLLLTKIDKKYLIQLILFIRNFCNLKISNKYINFRHDIYEIKIYNNKQCAIYIKESEKKRLKNIVKEEEEIKKSMKEEIKKSMKEEIKESMKEEIKKSMKEEIKEENINKNENIINEEKKNEIKVKDNNLKNENLINSSKEEYNDDIIIISSKKKYFYCINHNKSFICKEGLMSHCKATHKLRCKECGKFFGIKRKLNNHLSLCKNQKIKENKIK